MLDVAHIDDFVALDPAGCLHVVAIYHVALGPVWAPELAYPLASGEYEYDPARCVADPAFGR